jgi:hypothetical protein
MKTSNTSKLLIPLLSLGLVALPALKAQDQGTNATSTNSSAGGCAGMKKWHHNKEKALANLSDAERQQLKAAMGKIKNDPQLVAAREAVKESQTKEARLLAHQSLQKVRHDLLLKADPSIQSVLDKMKQGVSGEAPAPQTN